MTTENKDTWRDDWLVYRQDHLLVRARWRIVGVAVVCTVMTVLLFPLTQVLTPPQEESPDATYKTHEFSITSTPSSQNQQKTTTQPTQPEENAPKTTTDAPKEKPPPEIAPQMTVPDLDPTLSSSRTANPADELRPEIRPPQPVAFSVTASPPTEISGEAKSTSETPVPVKEKKPEAGPFTLSNVDAPPSAVTQSKPSYPLNAKRRGQEGFVKLSFVVSDDGSVNEAEVVSSRPSDIFNDSALRALKTWQFEPGTKDGKAVPVRMSIKIRFRLE